MKMIRTVYALCFSGLVCLAGHPSALGVNESPMQPWDEATVRQVIEKVKDFHPFPKYQERGEWEKIQTDPRFSDSLNKARENARSLKAKPLPALPASIYLDFQRTGRRTVFQDLQNERSRFLNAFTLAECLEGKGEYLDLILDTLWAFCEESDWCMPAHTSGLIDMEKPYIDLRAARMAMELAQLVYVFGDALPEALRNRIRYELERRTFIPYLNREFSWMKTTNNWNAVCNGNVMQAALYSLNHDPARLAKIVTRAQNSMCRFLTGFDKDGGTAEGIGYWNYGFGNYVEAAHLLNFYTQQQLNLLTPPIVKEIAQFPPRIELSPNKYPSFSDGGEDNKADTALFCYLADAFQLPRLRAFAAARMGKTLSVSGIDSLFSVRYMAPLPEAEEPFRWDRYNFLRGISWMISHVNPGDAKGLVVAAMGGSNDESHNHNDVGNIIVFYRQESLVVDPGAPVYDRDFFGAKRYTYFAARSLGHSVPLVNGFEQRDGKNTAAIVKTTHTASVDTLESDITAAYPPEAGLKKLVRTVKLHRSGNSSLGWVELTDEAAFKEPAKAFETALITCGVVSQPEKNQLVFQGDKGSLRVVYDPKLFTVGIKEFDSQEHHLHIANKHPVVRRVAFQALKPNDNVRIHLKIEPLP